MLRVLLPVLSSQDSSGILPPDGVQINPICVVGASEKSQPRVAG